MFDHSHRRRNALTGEWVTVSPHRTLRPWQGRSEPVQAEPQNVYDPSCYLCPGNLRANNERNPQYDSTFVFANDFPALAAGTVETHTEAPALLRAETQAGECRVVCFSPRHDLTLAQMATPDIRRVIDVWSAQTLELGRRWRWVQVFENKGELMGCSNPHPHGQIWATEALPNEATKELACQNAWYKANGAPLLLDYADLEMRQRRRIVAATTEWLALVPWWAAWPFETLIVPRRQVLRLSELTSAQADDLAALLSELLRRYDGLFETSFPYSMGWHGAPHDDGEYRSWQLHAHIYPPLLRSATIRKFMVGYEMFAEPQRDLTPESAAQLLRDVTVD